MTCRIKSWTNAFWNRPELQGLSSGVLNQLTEKEYDNLRNIVKTLPTTAWTTCVQSQTILFFDINIFCYVYIHFLCYYIHGLYYKNIVINNIIMNFYYSGKRPFGIFHPGKWPRIPKITQKAKNDTVGRYRFESNFDSKFYMRKKTFLSHRQKWGRLRFRSCEKIKIKKKYLKNKNQKWLNIMVPNFLYSNSYHFLTLFLSFFFFLLLLSLLLSYCPFISHWTASQLFFDISKQNLIRILFHRGNCKRSKITRKQCARSHFVHCMNYFEWNGPKKFFL